MKPTKHKPVIYVSFATMSAIDNETVGKKFFSFLQNSYPELYPEFADFREPIKQPVPVKDGPDMLSFYWKDGGLWKRRKNFCSEWFFLTPAKRYPDGMTKIHLRIIFDSKLDLLGFVRDASLMMEADSTIVVINSLTFKEQSDAIRYNHSKQNSGSEIRTFSEPMKNLGWLHMMTDRYVESFFKKDAERVKALSAEELGFFNVVRDEIFLTWQLTESPLDVNENLEEFINLRESAKNTIGTNFFLDVEEAYAQSLEINANFGKMFASSSVIGIAMGNEKDQKLALEAIKAQVEPMPEWEKVLRKHITDPERLEEAIKLTGEALNQPMPDKEKEPEKFEEEKKRRAAFLKEMIFPTKVENLNKPFSLKGLFGFKS